jgi:hypothetical protein
LRLLQIVPRLRPAHDGIGEHAIRLSEKLRSDHGLQSSFLICDPTWRGPEQIDGFPVRSLVERSQNNLKTELSRFLASTERSAVLVQFAPYGYEKRGIPFWLVDALKGLRGETPFKLLTMFHELNAAMGKPWSSTFWLSHLQKRLILQMARHSDVTLTNAVYHQRLLERWGIGEGPLVPSFSTVGESTSLPPWAAREKQVVVFGRASHRRLTYTEGLTALARVCKLIAAETVIDIGEPFDLTPASLSLGIPVISRGRLSDEEVSEQMKRSQASFLYYPEALLTKSSVFGATCAHGAIPFVASEEDPLLSVSELEKNLDYIKVSATGPLPTLPNLEEMSSAVYRRYQTRSSSASASLLANLIDD